MLIADLVELAPATRVAWHTAGIRDTDHLRRPAAELLALPGITGSILYETVCQLSEHHLGLPTSSNFSHITAPTEIDLQMLRLRIVDGASLSEIGTVSNQSRERVRQRLHKQFGLTGEPPAAMERRQIRFVMRTELERMIAFRLCQRKKSMSMSRLLAGFTVGVLSCEAQAALSRMEAKKLLTVKGDIVTPTRVLLRQHTEGHTKVQGSVRTASSSRPHRATNLG